MTREDIVKLIDKRKEELNVEFEKDYGYFYCKEIVDNINVRNVEDLFNLDIFSILSRLYVIKGNNVSTFEAEECFNHLKEFCTDFDSEGLDGFMAFNSLVCSVSDYDKVIEYLEEKNDFKSKNMLYKLFITEFLDKDIDRDAVIEIFKTTRRAIQNREDFNLLTFYKGLKNNKLVLFELLSLYKTICEIKEEKVEMERQTEIFEGLGFGKVRNKDKKKIFSKGISESYKTGVIFKDINRVKEFVLDNDAREKSFYKNRDKEINGYDTCLRAYDLAMNKDEVLNARDIVKNAQSEEIKNAFLRSILEHNTRYLEGLREEFNELSKNDSRSYQAILNDYSINSDSYDVKNIMHNKIEEVDAMIKYLSRNSFDENSIIYILSNTYYSVFDKIKNYVDNGFLSISFIKNNINLFCMNEDIIDKKYEILNEFNINPGLFIEDSNILLIDYDLFKNNILLLDSYGLTKKFKTTKLFGFIGNSKLAEKIDLLIELGYLNYLEDDLNILNNNNLNRLLVLKSLNMEISSKEEFYEIINCSRFFIPDNKIGDYLNFSDCTESNISCDIKDLNRFKINPNTYSFNGTLISVNKVQRMLNEGFDINDCIYYNSHLSEDEYKNSCDALKAYVLSK